MSATAGRRTRAWVLAGFAAALLAGLALGFELGSARAAHAPSYLEQLTEALELRPDQVARIETLLAEEDRVVDALLQRQIESLRDPVAAQRQATEERLLAELDAAQRERYQVLAAAVATDGAADGAAGDGAGAEAGRR